MDREGAAAGAKVMTRRPADLLDENETSSVAGGGSNGPSRDHEDHERCRAIQSYLLDQN
jgi:hypothetical protein